MEAKSGLQGDCQLGEQIADVKGYSSRSLSITKILRLLSLILIVLSFVAIHYFNIDQVGGAMHSENGDYSISAGTHPAMLVWTAIAIVLFAVLMVRNPDAVTKGVPSSRRRVLAFLVDFWFSGLILASTSALIPLWFEAQRTGHFGWQFQRDFAANMDDLQWLSLLVSMVLMILYFAFPLTRGRQTVGYFLFRLKLAPPFGAEGRFTIKTALVRTFYAFVGISSAVRRKWDRDGQGRTWYDRKTNCTVVFVNDD